MYLQISRDCQELEPSIGEQLASLLYLEPDSELMVRFPLNPLIGLAEKKQLSIGKRRKIIREKNGGN